MSEHHIRLAIVRGMFFAQKLNPTVRWCALTEHHDTGACGSSWRHARLYRESHLGLGPARLPSTMSTMHGGGVLLAVEKVLTCRGPAEVKKTWGVGYRALTKMIKRGTR